MAQKLRSNKRRILQGLKKHKLRRSTNRADSTTAAMKRYDLRISELAQLCWSYFIRVCCKLNLIPLQVNANGSWVLCSIKRRLIHYTLVAVGLGLLARNLIVSLYLLAHRGADTVTVSCLAIFMLSFVSMSFIIASSWSTVEMKDMLNSWSPSLGFIEKETGKKVSCFDSAADNLKIIGCTWVYHVTFLDIVLASLVFDDLPNTCFGSLKALGIIPESNVLPNFMWHLLLLPVELLLALSQAYTAVFNVIASALGIGLIRLYCNQMRSIIITDMESWIKVEKMYMTMRVYNEILMNCGRVAIGPVIFTCSTALVLLLYLSVRPSGLPLLIHVWVPFLTAASSLIASWLLYDIVSVKRLAQEVLETLQSKSHKFLWKQGQREKIYALQRARALRPVCLTIGQFADLTFRGLVGLSDEILNQLLFLLSL